MELQTWFDQVVLEGRTLYVKRLSGNDTLANKAHQAGPYVPKEVLFSALPALYRPEEPNPDLWLPVRVDSHAQQSNVRIVWYNNRLRGGTRNEARITNFGGRESALLDPENMGALALFAFPGDSQAALLVWVCTTLADEDLVEKVTGTVDPGQWLVWNASAALRESIQRRQHASASCWLDEAALPDSWRNVFPSPLEIHNLALTMAPFAGLDLDDRLIKRRRCEYQVFLSVEQAHEFGALARGFSSVDEFVQRAQAILQRRKARSGRSLELQVKTLLGEAGLIEGTHFSYQAQTEQGKRPDFLFPNGDAYSEEGFDQAKLRVLATKTTCKDRWRQVLDEADRVPKKHLLTLQEGISEGQMAQMNKAGLQLVVPRALFSSYPEAVRPTLMTVEAFVREVQALSPA